MTDKTGYIQHINDRLGFSEALKQRMASCLQESLEETLEPLPGSGIEESVEREDINITETEMRALVGIRQTAKQLGADDEGVYEDGQLTLTFADKKAVQDFTIYLEACADVDAYDIDLFSTQDMGDPEEEIDFDAFPDNDHTHYMVFVYLNPEIVSYDPAFYDEDEIDGPVEDGELSEVTRKIKINFRGKRRVKMQCNPGFKWDPATRSCKKITGAELATKRKALRRAVRTKKALGATFKRRVQRKTKRALKFRKSFGLR